MGYRLDGRNPLAYMGVRPTQPPQVLIKTYTPTANDVQNLTIGTFWIIPTNNTEGQPSEEVWVLVSQAQNQAVWIELTSGGNSVPDPEYSLTTSDGSGGFGTGVGPATAGYVLLGGGDDDYPAFVAPTAGSGLSLTTNASTLEYSLDVPIDVAQGGTSLETLTIHNVLIGNAANPITLVAPSATSGVPLVSNGAGSDPSFSVASVPGGGTGVDSFLAYTVICAGTTDTGDLQYVDGVGDADQVLTSNGIGKLPTWQTLSGTGFTSINVQAFTTSGTYTPTSGMAYCVVECLGGGGGGGGVYGVASLNTGIAGGSGGYARAVYSAATIGASQTVTVGAGGAGGLNSNPPTAGGNGGNTTFGSLMTGGQGIGGAASTTTTACITSVASGGGASANSQEGNAVLVYGSTSNWPNYNISSSGGSVQYVISASGGSSVYGSGGVGVSSLSNSGVGNAGIGYGAGGGGCCAIVGAGSVAKCTGGAGAPGICIVTEFIE